MEGQRRPWRSSWNKSSELALNLHEIVSDALLWEALPIMAIKFIKMLLVWPVTESAKIAHGILCQPGTRQMFLITTPSDPANLWGAPVSGLKKQKTIFHFLLWMELVQKNWLPEATRVVEHFFLAKLLSLQKFFLLGSNK